MIDTLLNTYGHIRRLRYYYVLLSLKNIWNVIYIHKRNSDRAWENLRNVTSDDSVLGRGFISHSPKISCQFATKIRMIWLTFMFTWTKNKIPFCPPLRPDFSKFSFCIFFIFGNHIKNHTTFLQVLATAAENCWNYEARHETSIRSVNMVLSCIILILVANWQGIFG